MHALKLVDRIPSHSPAQPDTQRFDALFQRLYPALYPLAYRLAGDADEAEDLLQDAFLRLADAAVLERPDEEVAAWLRRVCLNLGTNRLRDRRRAQARLERVGRLDVVDTARREAASPASALLRQEAQAEVRAALTRLPERQRDCLLLRYSGYSYAEIAATLEVAIGSVGVLLARAERAFRDVYAGSQGQGDPAPPGGGDATP